VAVLLAVLCLVVFLTFVLVVDGQGPAPFAAKSLEGNIRAHALRQDVLLKQDRTETLRYLGIAAVREGRYGEAKRHFLQYLDHRPDRLDSYLNLAITHLLLDEPDAALDVASQGLERAQQHEPGPFHFLLACAYYRVGELEAGADHLVRAHERLGEQVHEFATKQWATPLRQSEAYRRLANERRAVGGDPGAPILTSP